MLEDEADVTFARRLAHHVFAGEDEGALQDSGRAVSRPAMMRSRVVLPEPEGPSSETSSPF